MDCILGLVFIYENVNSRWRCISSTSATGYSVQNKNGAWRLWKQIRREDLRLCKADWMISSHQEIRWPIENIKPSKNKQLGSLFIGTHLDLSSLLHIKSFSQSPQASDLSCSSYGFPSGPLIIFTDIFWMVSKSFMSFLYCSTQNYPLDSRWGCTSEWFLGQSPPSAGNVKTKCLLYI